MNLVEEFFRDKPVLLNEFKSFSKKHKVDVIGKLTRQQKQVDFLAQITEVQFGIFLESIASSLSYENAYDRFTPDWTMVANGQTIIAEVMRLNPSFKDQLLLDFDESLSLALQEIEIACCVNLEYLSEQIDIGGIDLKQTKSLLENWLLAQPMPGCSITLFQSLEFTLVVYSKVVNHVCLMVGGEGINSNYNRLRGNNSALLTKAQKYSEIIHRYELPYILCVYLDFNTGFRELDLYQALYGYSTEHECDINYYSHSIEHGLYYMKEKCMADVSGVILRYNNQYTYFHNYSSNNKLSIKNSEIFLEWQHVYA